MDKIIKKRITRAHYNKIAQIQTQVFVYVIGLIIMGIILLYGYQSISAMREKGDQIDLLTFKTDMEQEVSKMSSDYGSARIITLKTPSGFLEVCFVDLEKNPHQDLIHTHPLVYESWTDKTANVFLIKDLAEEFQLIEENSEPLIQIGLPGYVCTKIKHNRVNVRLEGIGGKVMLSTEE